MSLTLDGQTAIELLSQGGVFWAKFARAGKKLNAAEIRRLA